MPLSCAVVPPTSVALRWSPVRVGPEISWQTNAYMPYVKRHIKTHWSFWVAGSALNRGDSSKPNLGDCQPRSLGLIFGGLFPDVQCKYTGQFWQICGLEFRSKTENANAANTSGTAACRRSTRGILFGHLSCCRFRWQALLQNLCLLKDSVDDLAKNCFIYCNLFFKKVNASAHQKC